jgi:shikimate kinase
MTALNNVVLIGMPAAGKSTLGVLLAKATGRSFVDTDVHIQAREGRTLQRILAEAGIEGFRRIEEEGVLGLGCRDSVIATGGSVVYGERAMKHLKASGVVVYLQLPLVVLARRIKDLAGRGVVMNPTQTLADLFAEREPLYRRYADVIVDARAPTHEEVISRIFAALEENAKV